MSITIIGLDTAKSVFQVHAIDKTGKTVIRRKLRRSELLHFSRSKTLGTTGRLMISRSRVGSAIDRVLVRR